MEAKRSAVVFAWLLLLPALLYITVIVAYPLVDTFILSFTDASLRKTTNWVGFINYEKIFNATFADVITRTFIWTFFSVSIKMIIGTFGAVLLNSAVPGRALFRILTMPPWIVPMAIGIFMWGWMYNGQFGMISGLLENVGLTKGPIAFLAYGNTAFWATIVTDVWIGVPMVTIYFLAAMQSIPKDLYEAAWTDGAGRLYRFRRITVPLMIPAIVTMSLLSLIATFNSFDIIWILTQGGPSGSTTTMIIDTYKTAMGSRKYGEGAARAVVISIFVTIFYIIDFQTAIVQYENGAALTFHTNINVPDDFRRFAVIGAKGMAEGDFVRNYFKVTDSRTSERIEDKTYQASPLSDHYGADEQMAADILKHLTEGAPLPVSVTDALEAGLLALSMDEAMHNKSVVDMAPIWQRFDAALGRGK